MRPFHELPPNKLAALDIAEVNLECATDLPGSENLDIPAALSMLDEWAEAIRLATVRHWPRFERQPSEFEGSVPYFCMLVMTTVLHRDLGVHYNLESLARPYDGTDSRLHFFTASSRALEAPARRCRFLYIALGRRLGYPLKLVPAMEHFFVRWDDAATGTRLNIEATSPGLNCPSDEDYHTFPKPIPPELRSDGWMLQSMTPVEEVAEFYVIRGNCFHDWFDYHGMLQLAYYANHLVSEAQPYYRGYHALATMLFRQYVAKNVQFAIDQKGEVVAVERGQRREAHPWEKVRVRRIHEDFDRLKTIHQARRDRQLDRAAEDAFATLSVDPDWLTRETFHGEECLPCTTQR